MKNTVRLPLFVLLALCLVVGTASIGCGSKQTSDQAAEQQESVVEETSSGLADGSYAIEVETDSSMFHADSCVLTVQGGVYTAALVLPGEGFSRLYFGSAEDAPGAPDDEIYDYYLNDEGKYTFDLPVEALDEELEIAAFGQRRDTWYPHTIVFHAPEAEASADAA